MIYSKILINYDFIINLLIINYVHKKVNSLGKQLVV